MTSPWRMTTEDVRAAVFGSGIDYPGSLTDQELGEAFADWLGDLQAAAWDEGNWALDHERNPYELNIRQ